MGTEERAQLVSREKRFGASGDMGGGSGVRRSFASIWSSLDEEAEEAAALERFAGILMAMIGSSSAADLVAALAWVPRVAWPTVDRQAGLPRHKGEGADRARGSPE